MIKYSLINKPRLNRRRYLKSIQRPEHLLHPRTLSGQVQKSKTRLALIEAAIPVFAKLGPDIPIIDDFAKAAGVSRGTFYNYFHATQDLLNASMEHMSDKLAEIFLPALVGEPNSIIRFAIIARLFYEIVRLDPVFCLFLKSVPNSGDLIIQHARPALEEAFADGLIIARDFELVEAIAFGVMLFEMRTIKVGQGGSKRGGDVVRAILMALSVKPDLIARAMQASLPLLFLRISARPVT